MGSIADIYADLETDVSEEEFREAVEEKVEQMGGLADEETAAMLLAHELNEGEVETVADIEPGMDEVKFIAKVMAIGDLKTFERDGEDEDGRVINVEAADATVDVEPGDGSTVEALTMGQSDVTLRGLVLDTDSVRTFDRDDGSEGKVSNLTLGDETGRVRVTMWDDRADRATEIEPGTAVEVVDGYVRERDGSLELHVGDDGAVDEIDEAVDFQPDADPIEAVELEETVDIAGVVRSADPVRTFDRDDGSEGQVRNIRIQDATGDIRVALWGDKADKEIQPGDEVLAADVEIQDGWQDDLEASASWNSTIVVLDDGTSVAPTPEAQADDEHAGLSSFGGDGADGAGSGDGGDSTAAADTDGGATTDAGSDGGAQAAEQVEFTGTVVQTGDPVVLDDGEQTMSVETGERVQLGQEVTVRGVVEDGRLDADDVF